MILWTNLSAEFVLIVPSILPIILHDYQVPKMIYDGVEKSSWISSQTVDELLARQKLSALLQMFQPIYVLVFAYIKSMLTQHFMMN